MTATPSKHYFTIPNAISALRILLAPVIVWLMLDGHHWLAAFWLLGFAGITDFLDGYLARHLGQVSDFGKVADPVADRILIVCVAVALGLAGLVPWWIIVTVLVRESIVSLAVLILGLLRAPHIDVVWVGKAGTLVLMSALPFFLLHASVASYVSIDKVVLFLAWTFVIGGLILGWYALMLYIPLAVKSYGLREAVAQNKDDKDGIL
ncbi:MAG: CDP-alcohol phosphatidyltransferase family protein [Actinobacteria bacterium]|nr:CDP-alcohol phosphatidyltransferase family protein [Actinomycetota bacterium]MCL6104103.1 CDP-alcohol phosphatidyltransferase family protein [Actinomycetota bacterium]